MSAQSNNTNNPSRLQILSAVIIPDGESLARSVGYDYNAISWMLRNIEGVIGAAFKNSLAEEAAAKGEQSPFPTDPTFRPVVRCPAKGRLMIVDGGEPSSASTVVTEARAKFITSLAMRSGWNVKAIIAPNSNNTAVKLADDFVFPLLQKDFFDPIGSSQQRQTATDVIVIVTNSKDESALPLIRSITSKFQQTVRRVWVFVQREARTEELEDWGKETGRLFSLTLPQQLAPNATAVVVASNSATASAQSTEPTPNNTTTTTIRAACPNFETCENARCLLRHGDNRRRICENQLTCCNAKCPNLHHTIHVRGVRGGPVALNRLVPTQGKRRALASLGWPFPLCPFNGGATCPHGERCRSLHFVEEEDLMQRAATGALVMNDDDGASASTVLGKNASNLIDVDGVPVLITKIEVTEGLKQVLLKNSSTSATTATSCTDHNNYFPSKCTLGEGCGKIHFKNKNQQQQHRDPSPQSQDSNQTNSGMGTRQSSSYPASGSEDFYSYYYAHHSHHKHSTFSTTNGQNNNNLLQPSPGNGELLSCVVCGDDFVPSFGVRCNAALHFTCDECLSSFISISWIAQQQLPGNIPDVRCPQTGCQTVLTDVQVCRHVTEEACEKYLERRQAARDANAAAKSMELANEMIRSVEEQYKRLMTNNNNSTQDGGAAAGTTTTATTLTTSSPQELPQRERTAAEKELWKQQLRGMFPNALMCPMPNCHYGPIVFEACDDLQSHHGEDTGAGIVDNSCKNCKFFAPQRSGWLRWDGEPRLTPEEIAEWHANNGGAKVTKVFAPDDGEVTDYDDNGTAAFGAVWDMTPDQIREYRNNRRQLHLQAPPPEQTPPVRGPWLQATSGQNIIIYHISGSVQFVFNRNAVGWLFSMRTPKSRQQTLYIDGLFFLDGAENRAVAMELNRNYREELSGNHTPMSDFFDGFGTVSKIDGEILDENSLPVGTVPCLTRLSLKLASPTTPTFDIVFHHSRVVFPSLIAQGNVEHGIIECDCSANWFMYSPLCVKEEQGILDGSIRGGNNRNNNNTYNNDDDEDSDPYANDNDDFDAEDDELNREIASDLVLIHSSGELAIALSQSSNGWLNFRDSRNYELSKCLFQGGETALQLRTSLDGKFVPQNQSSLVPIYNNFRFGNFTIGKDRITIDAVRVNLNDDGFGLHGSRAVQYKCTYTGATNLTQRIDGYAETKIRQIIDGIGIGSGQQQATRSTTVSTTNVSSVLQPTLKPPEPLPPPIRTDESISDDDVGFFTSIVLAFIDVSSIDGRRIIDNTRDMLRRFATPEGAVRFAQYCTEFKMDPSVGDSYSAFAKSAHSQGIVVPSNNNNQQQQQTASSATASTTTTTTTRVRNNDNDDDDDDDQQQQQQRQQQQQGNSNNVGPRAPSSPTATTTSGPSTTGTNLSTTSSRQPTQEELDNVIGLTGQPKAVSTFALTSFGNSVEQAVQYLFYCADQNNADPMSASTIMGFKRVLHRQQGNR